MSVHN